MDIVPGSRRFCTILYSLLSLIFYLSKNAGANVSQDSVILNKSLHFAARIVMLYQFLCKDKKEHVISKQIILSGTSIGANAKEAVYFVIKADFISKLKISL